MPNQGGKKRWWWWWCARDGGQVEVVCSSTAVQCDDGVRRGTKAHIGGGNGGWQLTGLGGPRMASRSRSRKCSRAAISPRYPVCPQRACKLPSGVRPSSSSAAGTGDPLRMAANGVFLCRRPDRSRPRVRCFLALTGSCLTGKACADPEQPGGPTRCQIRCGRIRPQAPSGAL